MTDATRWPVPARRASLPYAALAVAALSLSGFATVYIVAVRTVNGQYLENRALEGSTYREMPGSLLSLVTIPNLLLAMVVLIALALVRRRVGAVVRIVTILVLANGLTQLLKHDILSRPDLRGIASLNTFPSGHTVAFASVLLALLIAVPAGIRPLVALLATGLMGVVTFQLLEFGWHRASDVVGGLLLACAITAATVAVVPDRRGEGRSFLHRGAVWLLTAGCVLLGVATLATAAFLIVEPVGATTSALLLASELLAILVAIAVFALCLLLLRRDALVRSTGGRGM